MANNNNHRHRSNNDAVPREKEAWIAGGNRMLKSDVWEFFGDEPSSTAGGKDDKVICKMCGHTLSAYSSNGTGHLLRHIGSTSCMNFIAQLYDDLEAKGLVDI